MSKNKQLLLNLGLNDLEADVYLILLVEKTITGYRIGKILGKPTANVYKALDSLSIKGAIVMEDEKKSFCKAVPINEFCDMVESSIIRKTHEVKKNFKLPKKEDFDEKSYQIQSVDLVLEKSRQMLRSCKSICMIDVFPEVLIQILPEVKKLISRGVEVYLQVYKPVEVEGAHVVLIDISDLVLEYWKSQQLNLIIDGKEHLLALLDQDLLNVYQATWSRNLYLSGMLHMGFSNHYSIFKIRELEVGPDFIERVKDILEQQSILSSGKIPGIGEIFKRYGI